MLNEDERAENVPQYTPTQLTKSNSKIIQTLSSYGTMENTATMSAKFSTPASATLSRQTPPVLNPSAPAFRPKRALSLTPILTPAYSFSPSSSVGPTTPVTPTPAPTRFAIPTPLRPIPTHVTRRPSLPPSPAHQHQHNHIISPTTVQVGAPNTNIKHAAGRLFAPVIRGPDGVVRVLGPGAPVVVSDPDAMF